MQRAKFMTALGLFIMSAVILYAFMTGDFWKEGAILVSIPWGIVSLVDLYIGLFLFSGWIAYREDSLRRAGIWAALLMGLGFWIGLLYIFLTLQASQGDWKRFWLGKHRNL